ncbi:MAG: transglycosylase domain-containing protein, partial [Myxococcales bacterium]|nr:transglycosylase domain-containing protein [Myxococcales bacterium]
MPNKKLTPTTPKPTAPDDAPPGPRVSVLNRRRGGVVGTIARALAALLVVAGLAAGGAGFALYVHFANDLPRLDQFDEMVATDVTRFVAAGGEVEGEWYRERRQAVTWGQLPEHLILGFLAAEDERFFEHSGIDLQGIARAMVTNLREGSAREGASTITQQLAKTLVGSAKSYERKVKEAILARRMEDIYSKKQILTWYLNVGFLGHGSYGVQAAAQNYFRKNVWDLSLAECAMIAGLAQAPSRVNPAVDMPAAKRRMAHVLKNMRERGWITADEEQAANAAPLKVFPLRDAFGDGTPYYTEAVRQRVAATYDQPGASFLDRGLTVEMAVEPGYQRAAEAAVEKALFAIAKKEGYPGPLARMERDAFFSRNATYATAEVGARVLARVAEVSAKEARVEIGPDLDGVITLDDVSWAAPYTELPTKRDGSPDTKGRASWGGKLKAVSDALAVGDVVLVEVLPPRMLPKATKKAKKPKKPAPKKKPKASGKKTGGDAKAKDAAPKKAAEEPPKQDPRRYVSLVPVPMMEGALVSYGLDGGGVQALVGGWDFDRSEVDRTQSLRQTGSTIKPIVYSRAYELGLAPSSLFSGAPFVEGTYNPTGKKTKDDMLVWDALVKSENSVSLRVLSYVKNHASAVDYADYKAWGKALGLAHELQANPSEVLGTDQTVWSMARAFGAFALAGKAPDMALVRKVVDKDGRVLERHVSPLDPHAGFADTIIGLWDGALRPAEQVIPAQTAWLIARNLVQAVQRGTGQGAKKLGVEAAGKTGTLPYDIWFIGFTADRLAATWIGPDRRVRPIGASEKDNKIYGGDGALPAWLSFMQAVTPKKSKRTVAGPAPDGIVEVQIDPESGLLARDKGVTIPHRAGTEPTEYSVT